MGSRHEATPGAPRPRTAHHYRDRRDHVTDTDWTAMNRAMAAADARKAAGLAEVTASAVDRSRAILAQVESLGRGGRTAVGRYLNISDTAVGEHLARARGEQPPATPATLTLPLPDVFALIADHENTLQRDDLTTEERRDAYDEIILHWGAVADAMGILAHASHTEANALLATVEAEEDDGPRDEHGAKLDPEADRRETKLSEAAQVLLAVQRACLDREIWASGEAITAIDDSRGRNHPDLDR